MQSISLADAGVQWIEPYLTGCALREHVGGELAGINPRRSDRPTLVSPIRDLPLGCSRSIDAVLGGWFQNGNSLGTEH